MSPPLLLLVLLCCCGLLSSSAHAAVGTSSKISSSSKIQRVVTLTEENWQQINKGEWMIEFYAPWCPACRALHTTWTQFSEWTDDLGMDGVAQVDVTENPGLSGRFMVTALPTIYHVKDGEFRQYRGPRDKDSFISFIEDRKYSEVETIPSWKHPTSMQMSVVSYFFKMSMWLRNVHQTVTEDFGYPYWVSYVLFAVGTIVFGALLGLILVCCVDCIFPYAKHPHGQQQLPVGPITVSQKKKKEEEEDEEEEGAEIESAAEDDEASQDEDDDDEEEEDEEGSQASQGSQEEDEDEEDDDADEEREKGSKKEVLEETAVRKRRAKKAD